MTTFAFIFIVFNVYREHINSLIVMKKQTQAIHTRFPRRDAYQALSMPVYHTAAYEFDDAAVMADAFCGRIDAPDYSRVMNPTVTYFENKVKQLTGAAEVIAFSSGMAAISNTFLAVAAAGKNIITSCHMFDNKTLAIYPASTIFGPFSENQRRQMDVSESIIRLSVGLEDVDDLLEDIRQAAAPGGPADV